ncbi:hypothetical protein K435DRAFT_270038 [Dendrothele bispora CBS 962.96]|uniref:P-loop containing nucleoside triphosphate hydrolase protein n=1 Tax=Dendrothele bispora (strain CBS 962.96) TaxID=1314807 RepID=A0A4S8MN52_DENBC|nr:hypothetical protein K435DRAFT_270038 [Dendrothele bispora CBS 962.96]
MRTVSQSIIDDSDVKTINIQHYDRQQAGEAARNLLDALKPTGTVGISISQSPKGVIEDVAFATTNSVYIVKASKSNRSFRFPLERLFKNLLAGSDAESIILAGFDLPRLALRLFGHFGYHVKGVDLSTICSPSGTEPWLPAKVASTKFTITDGFRINSLWHENGDGKEKLCLRAWLSARIAQECRYQIESTTKVNTRNVEKNTLQCLGELLKQTDLLSKALPKETASEYDDFLKDGDGNYMLTNSRFKTRVRPSSQSKVLVTDARGDQYEARATGAKGKTTQVRFGAGKQLTSSGSVKNICVIGQDDPTNAERARSELLLKVLQGDVCLTDYEFIRYVWFTTEEDRRLLMGKLRTKEKSHFCRNGVDDPFPERLNTSQKEVVKGMVSPFEPMVVVHGPPGTGKTTTISSAANYWSTHRQPVWIVGHSNVCVKNIAEKLSERRVPFKVIVSKEFYFEWHEHIYKEIVEDVIRGDEMPSDPVGMERLLEGVQVILSTIGMLSNPALERNGTFSLVPVERLVVDEASQINNFEYMTIFQKFPKLEKVCFFGDPKQHAWGGWLQIDIGIFACCDSISTCMQGSKPCYFLLELNATSFFVYLP